MIEEGLYLDHIALICHSLYFADPDRHRGGLEMCENQATVPGR